MEAKTLGILGGGQLGRMSAMAARKLGIRTIIYTPEKDSPAAQIADETIVAAYEDLESLEKFSEKVEVISYEFENIPVETVEYLTKFKPVYPEKNVLEVAQDRIREKSFLNSIGIATARWEHAENAKNVDNIVDKWGKTSCILKTARFGYDGKGQSRYTLGDNLDATWRSLKSDRIIVEEIVDFVFEISVIVGRDRFGKTVTYGPMMNEHKRHILHKTTFPASIAANIAAASIAITEKLAQQINLRGVITLEMFVTKDGQILANEIAPRTHNSGHLTIDACNISQFEQHVRTVCGLPALDPVCRPAEMLNLIGDDIKSIPEYEGKPGTFVHLYGKSESRPGRKMGHITMLKKPG
ncbi:MAG TPA: 5-(carboxyamino)imidazole ribonucleotide synthase [Alphaproteobacteria bacterium]|nr:5-(carboxyamino)imidazole ribonucleotide synthase [Micavibrio sp.]MBK9563445.1 5-(carboxyamino)imidazole ribonucleotide synthase [Micavibrio sp.]HQX27529.1 5-(carboxyamino)imidazole ribonucleotide synthase [Alphaproteobacteria bacterium]